MNIKGTVVAVLASQSGEGKNGTWIKRSYVIEVPGDYPKKVSVSIWGDKLPVLKDGESVDCSVEVESKEYNGKWYTEVKCWKVDIISIGSAKVEKPADINNTPAPVKPAQKPAPVDSFETPVGADKLPF